VKIRFVCPDCACPGRLDVTGPAEWHCPRCDHAVSVTAAVGATAPSRCLLCDNAELYKKKDFPHGLGLTIILLGFAASTVTYWRHELGLTWAILLGTAAFDGLLYLLVKDVVVCYRCNAHYRGVTAGPEHKPFELTIHERYRQERIRREQLEKRGQGLV
jgi:hypothetical protein